MSDWYYVQTIYFKNILSLEESYKFQIFLGTPLLTTADFSAKPSVLMLGQYSTGKTTFVEHLLGRKYTGSNVGPEPTTSRFTVVMHGTEDRKVSGNTLTVDPDLHYQSLSQFGALFLSRLEGATCSAPLLEHLSIVDTPGVLSGDKQRLDRGYDFGSVRPR